MDGGTLDRVSITNVTMTGVNVPIFMRLGNRARPFEKGGLKPAVGTFRNVIVSNVIATGTGKTGCSITGLPGHPIENVMLSNLNLTFDGGGTKADSAREIPELPANYPESGMFGTLPAYGLYCRHVKGLKVQTVQLRTIQPDLRHALVCDDVEGLWLDGLDPQCSPGAGPVVRLTGTRGAMIRGCTLPAAVETFLQVSGPTSRDVLLMGNDLSRVKRPVQTSPEVPGDAVTLEGNATRKAP